MTPDALDIAVGGIILLSIVFAYFRGLVKEIFTLLGLGLAVFTSYKGGDMLIPGMDKWLKVPVDGCTDKTEKVLTILSPCLASKVASYGGIFLLVFLLMTLLGFLISLWLKKSGLGILDRLLGAGFGFARGFLVVFLLYIPFHYLLADDEGKDKFPEWATNSTSVPILQKSFEWADKRFGLDKMIDSKGDEIVLKVNKGDLEKLGDKAGKAADDLKEELKEEIKKEEKEIQKGEAEAPAPIQMPEIQQQLPPEMAPSEPPPHAP